MQNFVNVHHYLRNATNLKSTLFAETAQTQVHYCSKFGIQSNNRESSTVIKLINKTGQGA